MKLLLFLGSGVSLPSRLPGVVELTQKVLNDTYFRNAKATGEYSPIPHQTDQQWEPMDRVQELLKFLKELDTHYLNSIAPYKSGDQYHKTGAIYRTATTYEDLFYLSEQITCNGQGLLDDAPMGAFVDLVEREAGCLLEGENRDARAIDLYRLASEASRFIQWIVARSLHAEHIDGLDLVVALATAQWIERLDIITLNHDTLIEQVLAQNNIAVTDGFEDRDGDVRWYDDTLYDEPDARVRIFKPHGSINWYSYLVDGRRRHAILVGPDAMQSMNRNREKLRNDASSPSFLSGVNKIVSYNKGIYSDILYRFHQVLRESDLMVMSGYGWGDTAINFKLEHWLDSNKRNTIVLLHEKPEELMQRSVQLDSSYKALERIGQLVPLRQWLCNTSLADLEAQFGLK